MGGGETVPWSERQSVRELERPSSGLMLGTGGGRTDKNNVTVPPGAYVLPADIISGMGGGNTMGGAAVWDKLMRSLPYGVAPPAGARHGAGPPHAPAPFHEGPAPTLAKGGEVDEPVPIAAADGEIIVPPHHVYAIGSTYFPQGKRRSYDAIMTYAHNVLDEFVKHKRGENIKDQQELPGPENSKNADDGHKEAA